MKAAPVKPFSRFNAHVMTDIRNRDDVVLLIDTFYGRVRADGLIGHIFSAIIGDDWSAHLPVMYSFWATVLLGQEGYKGNAVAMHIGIDKQIRLEAPHFERWLALWNETIDSLFAGEIAADAKRKAVAMSQLIQFKVNAHRAGKSLL